MDVYFAYWMNCGDEGKPDWHAFYKDEVGSDVSDDTLNQRKIPIPFTPTLRTYNNLVSQGLWKVAK